MKYFLDTCIWRDFYENRYSKTKNPIGRHATKLLNSIITNKYSILFEKGIIFELNKDYSMSKIENMLNLFKIMNILKITTVNTNELLEAKILSKKYNIPKMDSLFAIIARNNNATLITRDKHFFRYLQNITNVKKPEDII